MLITWYNPNSSPDQFIPGEEAVTEWRARPIKLNLWREYTRLAWAYNPTLAIFLPQRIRNAESIEDEVTRLVCGDPIAVAHIPDALKYLVTTKTLLDESSEVKFQETIQMLFDYSVYVLAVGSYADLGTSGPHTGYVVFFTSVSNASAFRSICSQDIVVVSSRSSTAIHSTARSSSQT